MKDFKIDYRKSNPTLHLLYMRWAVHGLALIDQTIARLHREAKTSFNEAILGLQTARRKLVDEEAAWADAHEILEDLRTSRLMKTRLPKQVFKKEET